MTTGLPTAPLTDPLTEAEAAKILRVAPGTLLNWRYKGRGPKYVKHGGIIRYRRTDLDAFLEHSIVDPVLHTPRRRPRSAQSTVPDA